MEEEQYTYVIPEGEENIRIDKWLSAALPDVSRSFLQKLIENGNVRVGEKEPRSSYKLKIGDVIELTIPPAVLPDITPENIPLDILYEDDHLLFVNKPKGMVVHPAPGHYSGTLVNAAMYHCGDGLSGINGVLRPGIVHRIDRDTTGSIVLCKTDEAHKGLAEQFKLHSISREYRAIITGHMPQTEGTIKGDIGRDPTNRLRRAVVTRNGKPAVTHYRVLEEFPGFSYISCKLETGRTHQIRVHFASKGHPLVGDTLYGGRTIGVQTNGQCLHAMILGVTHPLTHQYLEVEAPLPDYFERIMNLLRERK